MNLKLQVVCKCGGSRQVNVSALFDMVSEYVECCSQSTLYRRVIERRVFTYPLPDKYKAMYFFGDGSMCEADVDIDVNVV